MQANPTGVAGGSRRPGPNTKRISEVSGPNRACSTNGCSRNGELYRAPRFAAPFIVRSWLVGSGSTEPCLTTRTWQNRPATASGKFGSAEISSRRSRWESLSARLQITSGRLQENLAQRRRDAKYGFPQFNPPLPLRLGGFARDPLLPLDNHLAREWFGNGMIEIRACAIPLPYHSSAILSLTERRALPPGEGIVVELKLRSSSRSAAAIC